MENTRKLALEKQQTSSKRQAYFGLSKDYTTIQSRKRHPAEKLRREQWFKYGVFVCGRCKKNFQIAP